MHGWLACNIDEEIESSFTKRYNYNSLRRSLHKSEPDVDVFKLSHDSTSTFHEKVSSSEVAYMDMDISTNQNRSPSSGLSIEFDFDKIKEGIYDELVPVSFHDTENNEDDDDDSICYEILNTYENLVNFDQLDNYSSDEYEDDDLNIPNNRLHRYTNVTTVDACIQLMHLFRNSQISKAQSEQFLSFISNLLPIPNNFPRKMEQLISEIDIQTYYYTRIVCSICGRELDMKKKCLFCQSFENKNIVYIYDTEFSKILTIIVRRLHEQIANYREKFSKDDAGKKSETHDIPFANIYKTLRKSYGDNIISLLFHLDGIGICKSTKLKMWILTASIIELPPPIRYRRENMPLISVWFSCATPNIDMWLSSSIERLVSFKSEGRLIVINNILVLR